MFTSPIPLEAARTHKQRRFLRQPLHRLIVAVALLSLIAGVIGQPAEAASDTTFVLPQLLNDARSHPNQTFRVIIQRVDRRRDSDGEIRGRGGEKIRDLGDNSYVAELPGKAIEALGRHAGVKLITYDAPMLKTGLVSSTFLSTVFASTVNATTLWGGISPVTGAGVGVAVIDTGIQDLPDFKSAAGTSRIVVSRAFNGTSSTATDPSGHGTHVAGIIAGNSWKRLDVSLQGRYIGIAPEANLINIRVSDDTGKSYTSDVVDAIDWVIANRNTYNIRVMNLSLVSSVAESAKTSILAAAVERAWFNGILVVVAAGNSGPNTALYPPANDPFVVTVGASDPKGTPGRADDGMASWSSYGHTQDNYVKPDVIAPGRSIIAPLASSTCTLAKSFPTRIVSGNYIWMSGTSMSAPIVSGIAALAFQAHPHWSNDQVKLLLMQTASKTGGATPYAGQGAGQVDAYAAVRYSGPLGFANQGLMINENLVTEDGSINYNSASWSTASWSTASWSTASWSTASWSTSNRTTQNNSVNVEVDTP